MGRSEWILIGVMLAIAFAAMFSGGALDGTPLGLLLAGQPLPDRPAVDGTAQVMGAIMLLAALVFLLAQMLPGQRDFLRTGSIVLLAAGVLYAIFDSL
jgi:hypothetical protein